MCGIAGFVNKNIRTFDENLLHRMAGVIAHRGPDGEGFFADKVRGVGIANRRLSIIDIAGGAQPMSNDNQSICITYNGELYNFPELRKELEAKGKRFRTRSSGPHSRCWSRCRAAARDSRRPCSRRARKRDASTDCGGCSMASRSSCSAS